MSSNSIKSNSAEPKWQPYWGWVLAGLGVIALVVKYALPIQDGDIWFHMAYGRYFIDQSTIIPDHTLFSWTVSDNNTIYCTWLPDILLYLAYQVGKLPLLFTIRYAGIAVFFTFFWVTAVRTGSWRNPITGVVAILSVAMSDAGIYIKPELFSYVFMSAIVLLFWRIKQRGADSVLSCYLFPLIMLVWVNCHGAFIFGILFIAVVILGETLNALLLSRNAMPSRLRKHLLISAALTFLMVFVTPYGAAYPKQLFRSAIDKLVTPAGMQDFVNIIAYQPVYKSLTTFYFVYFVLACMILISLIWFYIRKRGYDWTILLTNGCFAVIYLWLLRSTYFFVPVFAFSFLYMISAVPEFWSFKRKWLHWSAVVVAVGLSLGLAGNEVWKFSDSSLKTSTKTFDVSYKDPVAEAAYIKDNIKVDKVGNTYDNGAYLLWKLWPETKVMVDSRYFPYKRWFKEYELLVSGTGFDEFVKKSNCSVWCIDYYNYRLMRVFLGHSEWKRVFCGPAGVVFARNDLPVAQRGVTVDEGIYGIRNYDLARRVFLFLLAGGEDNAATRMLDAMGKRFQNTGNADNVADLKYYMAGIAAQKSGDYFKAAEMFEKNHELQQVGVKANLVMSYIFITDQYWRAGKLQEAYRFAQKALSMDSSNQYALFNTGIIGWYLDRVDGGKKNRPQAFDAFHFSWKRCLEEYLGQANKNPKTVNPDAVKIAADILHGQYSQRPPVLVP